MLGQLPATSNPITVGGMCYAILNAIELKSHCGTNYKWLTTNHGQAYNRHPWVSTNQK